MIRRLSLVSLSIGTVLIIYGFNALDAVVASFRHFVTEAPTNPTVWLMIVGAVLFCLGGAGAIFGPNPIGRHIYSRPASPAPYQRGGSPRPFWRARK